MFPSRPTRRATTAVLAALGVGALTFGAAPALAGAATGSSPGTAAAAPTTAPAAQPPIDSLVPEHFGHGLLPVPPGVTNGPLTVATFAGMSTNQAEATAEFDRWSAEPGFGGFLRTWKDVPVTGPPTGTANMELLRFATQAEAAAVEEADASTFTQVGPGQQVTGTEAVPGIPGAIAMTVAVTNPPSTIQGVLFRHGGYVCVINTVVLGAGSPGLPPGTAIQAAQFESMVLSMTPPVPSGVTPATAASGSSARVTAPSVSVPSSSGSNLWYVLGLLLLAAAGGVAVVSGKGRRLVQQPAESGN